MFILGNRCWLTIGIIFQGVHTSAMTCIHRPCDIVVGQKHEASTKACVLWASDIVRALFASSVSCAHRTPIIGCELTAALGMKILIRQHRALRTLITFGKNNDQPTLNTAWTNHLCLAHFSADLDCWHPTFFWSVHNGQRTVDKAFSHRLWPTRNGKQTSNVVFTQHSVDVGHVLHLSSKAYIEQTSNIGHRLPLSSIASTYLSTYIKLTRLYCLWLAKFDPSTSNVPACIVSSLNLLDDGSRMRW